MSIRLPPVLLFALILSGTARAASIFTTQLPAAGDSSPNSRSVELGVRFRADSAGQITGLRFYKNAGNAGPHTGHLWTNAGALLGSLTFTGETATGWQSASFPSPIAIQAGTTYVASYHTAAIYAVTRLTFSAAGIDNPPLHALRDGLDGVDGSYVYSSAAAFPNRGTRSSNYWVDVLFSASGSDGVPPTVTVTSPAAGASVRGTVAVSAAASDNVAVTTVQFKLDGAPLGPPDFLAPYTASWNTASSADGAHSLSAVAWDAAGNASTSAAVSVTADNTPPVIGAVAVTNVGQSSAAVAWTTNEPSSSQVEYGTSTVYGSVTALDAAAVTGHLRLLSGLLAGTVYHYRARSTDAAGNLAVSGDGTFTTAPAPPVSDCLTSAGAWQNIPFPAMTGDFTATFDATPHAAGMDGVMGLSNGGASAFAQLADIVRFNTAGFIDARNGAAYASAAAIPYSAGTSYRFSFEVSLASHAYSVFVSSPGASRQAVGIDYAFRSEQNAASSLDNMGFIAGIGGETVCGLSVSSDTVAPSASITSPASGAKVRGIVAVLAAASDNIAVAGVQFKLDGADLGPPDLAAPYAASWNTALSADGAHALSAVAWDAAGNDSTSAAVSVTADNTPPLISSVAAANVGASSAAVSWITDEPSTSQVEYGTSTAYGSLTALDASTVASHARLLSGLASGTSYHYRVRSADAAGNLAVSGDSGFFTQAGPDAAPPTVEISSPTAAAVIAGTAAVTAAAFDNVAVAAVQFKLDGADLGPPDLSAPFAAVWNTALSSDGPHALSAVAWDAAGNSSTSAAVSVTVDNTPPLISSVAVTAEGIDYAALSWITGEPAASRVEYGTSAAYGGSTALDPSTTAVHDAFLGGLSTGTLYHYRVLSADAAGNPSASADSTFTTAAATAPASFFDDFSSYTPNVCLADGAVFGPWTSVFAGYGCTSVKADGARSWLEESPFASASSSETHAALVSGLSFSSPMNLAVDVRTTSQLRTNSPPNPWEVAWVIWNYADNAHFYYFIPKPDGWELGKEDPAYPGGQRFLAAGSSPVFPVGGAYHVKIVQRQNILSAYVDGVLITTFTDIQRPYTSGHISLYTEDAASRFANVAVNVATPSISILSPQNGAFLGGTVAVTAAAFDDVAVATVQFRLDGADLGPPDNAAPYTAVWTTAASSEGVHSLTALAWDADGHASTSAAVSVTVDNTAPVISSVVVMDVGGSSAAVSWVTDEPANSRVDFGTSAAYGSATAPDASTATAHGRSIGGLSAGTLYHYRVASADAAGNLALSGDGTFTTAPAGAGCRTSAGDWRNEAIPPQVSSFTVSFDVTPSSAGMDASIGLSSGAAGSLAALAAGVRFNPQGFIDVRYSTAYASMSTVAYSTGTSYRFDLRVSASAHIFDVYVATPGSPRILLARNYTFQTGQSTGTVLDNLGFFASSGAATMCDATVSASTVPWWDGIKELYATAAGSKTWYSTWDNGINRSFSLSKDPTDPWFDALRGTANYVVDADSGVFKISGSTPRMYIHHPEFVRGSSSSTVAGAYAKQWHDVEMTVYAMRIADGNIAYAGIDGIARSGHGVTGDETVDLCDSRGIGGRFRNDGRLDFEKETRHPTSYVVNTTTSALWPSGTSMPFNAWIGYKYVVYDLPNGNVKVENYMDMTNGAGGGSWILVNQFEDDGSNWGGGTGCRAGVNPRERLTNNSNRPGSESGLPNSTVYFRSDGVGANGLLYKKMSVREIIPPSGGAGPLAAAGAAAESAGAAPAAAEEAFFFRDLYAFPNPSRRGERVTIRLQAGVADEVNVDIFDLSGRRVNGGGAAGPILLDDGNGKGAQYTYDYQWDVSGARSAVYFYSVKARKRGQPGIGRTGKVALIK